MARPRKYPIRSRSLAGAAVTHSRCPENIAQAVRTAALGWGPDDLPERVWRAWKSFVAQSDAEQNQVGMADELRDLDDIENEARIVAGWIESGADGPECATVACRLAERLTHFPNRLWAETTTWPRDDALAFENARARLAETVWHVADWLNHRDALAADLALLIDGCLRLRATDLPRFTKRHREARSELQESLEAIYRDHVAPDYMEAWRDSHDANDPPPPPRHRAFAQSVMRSLGVRFEPKPRRA